ncbi:Zinc phosphodiesterase ELAC protein 1 [Hypsizygus marmoreus]|uniref:Zinc phosphodiesterase ELAC protein 1 n=1 Tax=Hypsizygus marmoreus TaxID=39966 RepID=A0A369JKM1_HYPMA|nr:Zinc phosphodiesterase ELAC protein 1 [Hypsizygus marmoreus]
MFLVFPYMEPRRLWKRWVIDTRLDNCWTTVLMLLTLRLFLRQSQRFGAIMSKKSYRADAGQSSTSTSTSRSSFSSINITFLGTASAQPSSTRNHSSLALHLGRDVWLFDCGEATQHQIQKSGVKMGKIEKIFITHTHGDHIFGLIPLLASCMNGAGGTAEGVDDPRTEVNMEEKPLEIYGPLGTRAYVRNGISLTHTLLGSPYVVHELRSVSDPQHGDFTSLGHLPFELPSGRNIPQVDGVWTDIFKDDIVSVSAAPIHHSIPCLGFVVTEAPVPGRIDPKKYIPDIKRTNTPMTVMRRLQQGESVQLSDGTVIHGPPRRRGRKVAILGDTFDPSPIIPLALDADLLVHEATNAHLPGADPATKDSDTYETVEARAKSRGHSTPQMAGTFAKRIRARSLVLNHFSPRYPGGDTEEAIGIMRVIADLATKEYGKKVRCAKDLMTIEVKFEDRVLP